MNNLESRVSKLEKVVDRVKVYVLVLVVTLSISLIYAIATGKVDVSVL